MNTSKVLFSKKFWPLFWTQFFGAMNDNILKNAIVILITFKSLSLMGVPSEQMVALCGGFFILPYFLFSALAGELTDKYPMHKIIRFTKLLEIFICLLAFLGFYFQNLSLLMSALFLIGAQSTFFGPAKYSILPELLNQEEIVSGNALIEMGTFLAILIGTIIGGVLIGMENGELYVSLTLLVVSIIGFLTSIKVNAIAPINSSLKINLNFIQSTVDILKISRETHSVFISILGISWFWFYGATILSLFPIYVKNILNGEQFLVTIFLAIFSIGVALGSILCEKMSRERLELGLVPLGSIGLTLFAIDISLIQFPAFSQTMTFLDLWQYREFKRLLINLVLLSIMSGFFIVPLYTFIQLRSKRENRSRIIAANNILNALFMVAAALLLAMFYKMGFGSAEAFMAIGILNLFVAIYIYTVIPEFLWRLACVVLSRLIYRIKIRGQKNIPHEGPAIIVCNHVSFVDWLILAGSIKRPVRFVMHYSFANIPILNFFFKGAKVIPIAGAKENPQIMEEAFIKIKETLDDGEIVCIFPEGKITKDGELNTFRPGIERILKDSPVPVIPMALHGLWGSFFSRKYGAAATKFSIIPYKIWSQVHLIIDNKVDAEEASAQNLENITRKLLTEDVIT